MKTASKKQLDYIKALLRKPHDPELNTRRLVCWLGDSMLANGIYAHEASKFIRELLFSIKETAAASGVVPEPTGPRPMTEKQTAFIEKLMAKPHDEKLDEAYHPGLTTKEASVLIDQLLKAA